jgi:hypothetical protein
MSLAPPILKPSPQQSGILKNSYSENRMNFYGVNQPQNFEHQSLD